MTDEEYQLRQIVVDTAKNWPKKCDAKELLKQLDIMARKIINIPKT